MQLLIQKHWTILLLLHTLQLSSSSKMVLHCTVARRMASPQRRCTAARRLHMRTLVATLCHMACCSRCMPFQTDKLPLCT